MSRADRRSPTPAADPRAPGHLALGPGAEFDVIRQLLGRWGDAARDVGSDCAVIDVAPNTRLVVSTDASVENVHFRRSWLTPPEIGYRAAAAALSDLAAAAAQPLGLLVAMTVPPLWRADLVEIADGIGQAARETQTPVLGGDTTAGSALVLTVTVFGAAAHPLTRWGARPGDRVYVSGRLGGPAAALRAWARGATPDAETRQRFRHPQPRIREALWLAARGSTAAVDISDGLIADLGHVAAASGAHIVVDIGRLPRWPTTTAMEAAASGEEYEIAVTVDREIDVAAFSREFDVPLTELGRVVAGPTGVEVWDGPTRVDRVPGYDHFSGESAMGPPLHDPSS